MSWFERITSSAPDPILGLTATFLADNREQKVNLGVGYYKDEALHTPILTCVKEAERIFLEQEESKEYLPIEGNPLWIEKMGELVFGEKFWKKEHKRIAGFQTVGGTGALKIAGDFFHEELNLPICLPSSTWPNHRGVFERCQMKTHSYPYYDKQWNQLDFQQMHAFLEKQEQESIILFHASCHNPTGIDPTFEQWKAFEQIMAKKEMIPFFDFAYQGFGEGIDKDAQAVRYFAETGCEMFVACSSAKNFSLYGERVGGLFIITENDKSAERVRGRVKQIIRTNYSNPPKHGAALVTYILSNALLKEKWIEELKNMRERIKSLRKELAQRLISRSQRDWKHLEKGNGMFCFTGLQEQQVDRLTGEYGIYLPRDGRINICGLNHHNINYVVDAISSLF